MHERADSTMRILWPCDNFREKGGVIVWQPVEMTISAASVQKKTPLIPNKLYFVVFLQASMSPKMITIYMTATRMRTMGVWVRNMKSCTVRRSGHTSPQDLNTSKYPSDIPPDSLAGCKIWVKQQCVI